MSRAYLRLATGAIGVLLTFGQPAQAGIVTYSNRASFDAAAPGLPVEGFENARITTLTTVFGPLGNAGDGTVFLANDILPGITITSSFGGFDFLFISPAGYSANPTLALGQEFSDTSMDLLFPTGASAVGFDLYQNFYFGAQSGVDQDFLVQLFDTLGNLIGSPLATIPSNTGGFFGVTSDSTLIGKISIIAPPNSVQVIDNIAFGLATPSSGSTPPGGSGPGTGTGSVPAPGPAVVHSPEPASLAIFGLASAFASLSLLRRKHAKPCQ